MSHSYTSNKLKTLIISILLHAGLFSISAKATTKYVEGTHYIKLKSQNEFIIDKQPEVVEMFYYGCPYCRQIQPFVKDWLKRKPANVNFHYLPAFFSPHVRWSVQLHYVAFVLGKHMELKDEIYTRYANRQLHSQNAIYEMFANVGVDKQTVIDTYGSFAVQNLMQKAQEVTRKSEIEGTPAFIVKGKYRVSAKTAGGIKQVFNVIDYLLRHG